MKHLCIDCIYLDHELPEDGGRELCYFDMNNPVEINYFDKACPNFELSDSANEENKKK